MKIELPAVSIIMSVYNEELYISECIESILAQTFGDFELIIIDDASQDRTVELISKYRDERIRLFCNHVNCGLTKNLNKGIRKAKGKYVMRMDGDDIMLPNRIKEQFEYMEKNPNIALSSCGYIKFDSEKCIGKISRNMNAEQIRAHILYNSILPHPGFIMRRDVIIEKKFFYNTKIKYAQDYELQSRILSEFEIGLIKNVLFKYRVSNKQIGVQKREEQMRYANITRKIELKKLGISISGQTLEKWGRYCRGQYLDFTVKDIVIISFVCCRILLKCWKRNSEYTRELFMITKEKYSCFLGKVMHCSTEKRKYEK